MPVFAPTGLILSAHPRGARSHNAPALTPFSDPRAQAGFAGRRRPVFATMTATAALLTLQQPAVAAPQGGNVVAGSATISQSGNTTTINQSTNKAIINWQNFSVGKQETVDFNQPSSSSVTLNRVIGNETSIIAGAINANGQVFIVNSAGILFTGTSQVNVGGLVASTLDISNADFLAGNYVFSGSSTGSVVNRGALTAADGGYISLMGKTVSNAGVITATLGTVALSSGSKVTLNFDGNSLVDVSIDQGVMNALVENKQLIKADGGKVIMTAKAADAVLSAQVNNTGVIQARTMAQLTGGGTTTKKGAVTLKATGGTTRVSGKIDASAPTGGDGGSITVSGNKVALADGAVISTLAATGTTGSLAITADRLAVAEQNGVLDQFRRYITGDDGSVLTSSQVAGLLALNNVTLASASGSLDIDGGVSWSANTKLALAATNDININASITATGTRAGLVMNYGGDYIIASGASVTLSGADASLAINGQSYTLIHTMAQLEAISPIIRDANGNPVLDPDSMMPSYTDGSGYYALAQNLDASGTTYDRAVINSLTSGTLAGMGHTISNLTINATTADMYGQYADAVFIGTVGTFSDGAGSATVRDLGLVNVNVEGGMVAAGLVGYNFGTLSNVYVTGKVTGGYEVAGLASFNNGLVTNSHADVAVTAVNGGSYIGGLVGFNSVRGVISHSYATGPVTAAGVTLPDGGILVSASVGGLAGVNAGSINNSYATGTVTTHDSVDVGGLVGTNYNFGFGVPGEGTISNSYATGNVSATFTNQYLGQPGFGVGGLVGHNDQGTISGSSASGNVTVTTSGSDIFTYSVGGLVGYNLFGTISNSSASGNVTGNGNVYEIGGLVGTNITVQGEGGGGVSNSTASGNVAGHDAGGLVGAQGGDPSTVTNSSSSGAVNGVGGTPAVQPWQAAVTAVQSAANAAMVSATTGAQATANNPPSAVQAKAGSAATAALSGPSVASHIDDRAAPPPATSLRELEEARRKRASAQQARPAVARQPGFGGTIRSIDVDGQHFDLEKDSSPAAPAAPTQPAAPAPAAR
ncbi:GLUG motif-containing protein [Xanthobacter autotrophicus DSM 431]|uniref:two-partner secretion domain-containing protein n=1 Tax=Xanthobacter nonsaccharivorans TaxID=3119912 RepID=UPI0037292D6D